MAEPWENDPLVDSGQQPGPAQTADSDAPWANDPVVRNDEDQNDARNPYGDSTQPSSTSIGDAARKGFQAAVQAVGEGGKEIGEAVTNPGVLPTAVPRIIQGALGIASWPIAGAGKFIEEADPTGLIKKAESQDVDRPAWSPSLESPASVLGTLPFLRGAPKGGGLVRLGQDGIDPAAKAATDALNPSAEPAGAPPTEPPPAAADAINTSQARAPQPLNRLPFAEDAEPLQGGHEEITPRAAPAPERPLNQLPYAEEAEPLQGSHEEISPPPRNQQQAPELSDQASPAGEAAPVVPPKGAGSPTIPEDLSIPEFLRREPAKIGGAEVAGQNENIVGSPAGTGEVPLGRKVLQTNYATPTEDEAVAAMKPQSLSGAAAEGEKNFTPAEVAKAKSSIGDAWKKLTRPWNTAMAPENLDEETRLFGLAVRGSQAETNRFRLQGDKAREEFDNVVNKLPGQYHDQAARTFQNGTIPTDNPISRLAKPMFDQETKYAERLEKADPEGTWQQQHLPSMFADPVRVRDQIRQWVTPIDEGGEGRKGPFTIGDVMDAGFKLAPGNLRANGDVNFPRVLDNLHASRDNYLEANGTARKAYDDGVISKVQRPGDKLLDGLTLDGSKLYAQPDVAMMWDRYSPSAMDQSSKNFVEKLQKVKNAGNAWQMTLGAYHMFAETGEAMNGDVMRATSTAAGGKFGDAAKKLVNAPLAPIRQATSSAREALEAYYTPEKASPRAREDINDLVAGGLTAARMQRYTPDLNTAGRNFWEAWKKGALKMDFEEKGQRISNAAQRLKTAEGKDENILNPIARGAGQATKEVFGTLGEAMQTMMHPMFNVYIPRLKIGAALEQIRDWKAANPDATPPQRAEIAKRILKSIDDRLGEMNQSTLFWNKTLQRSANMMFISPTWETGTVRGAVGGLTSLVKNPKSISVASGMNFQPNAAFPLAFAITTAALGSVYEFLKTGQMPASPNEAFFPKTGGKEGKEQAILPGYMKDVYSWWGALAGHEALPKTVAKSLYNKLALVPHATWDTMANENWAGKQIYNPSAPVQQRLQQYLQYVHDQMLPIAYQQASKGEKGSNITMPERIIGIKKAPSIWEGQTEKNNRAQKEADTFRAKQQKKLAGYAGGGEVKDPFTVTPEKPGQWSDEDEARLQSTNNTIENTVLSRGMNLNEKAIANAVRPANAKSYAEGGEVHDARAHTVSNS